MEFKRLVITTKKACCSLSAGFGIKWGFKWGNPKGKGI